MHVHAPYSGCVRTTIEISDEHRSRLLEAAARRGQKGFSAIIEEALDHYFEAEESRRQRLERALKAVGGLSEPAAERFEKDARALRRSWR
jgi:predicted transcriptional regulator